MKYLLPLSLVALMSCGSAETDTKAEENKTKEPAVNAEAVLEVEAVTNELDSTTNELKSGVEEMKGTLDTLLTL